ncbi:highly derived D5-like helicase-primase [Rhizophagus irregularis DAOM 181602=DAOM 197198]|nr:highly derived D5-like helicase-primase [Rhizophagus irregularis DAOM 181602=DAOM 197198]
MTTQTQVISKFGEQKKAFSIDELKRLINAAKSMSDLDQAKRYFCSYFIPCADPHGVFWWDPDSKSLKHIIDKNIGKLIHPITKAFYTQPEQGPSQKTEFNIYKWFMVENTDDNWCSGDWNLTEYIIKWLAGVSAGRKMYSILYLKSGQGWGKGIITDFIQRSVLGTQLVYKTSDPQTILESFNGQLQGKVLLLLEEMPTEKSQWNNLYRSLKDKVMSDIMEIHEKYKMPTHYKNFMSTIVLTNENALRVENDDRRTVFLDVSPSRKGDLNYFKKLGDAMKYLGASEAFYAYLRAIADTYPDFNENPPPMTTSKQEHIISTLPPLFQFIKDTYLVVKNYMTDLSVQEFYRVYTSYCETHYISPLSKINASRILSNELGINSKVVRKGGKTPRVYSISREDLYKKYLGKNWIHETDEIDIEGIDTETPKKPASDPKALEKFLANIYNPANNSQDVQEKPAEEKLATPEPNNYNVLDDLLSDSNFTTADPVPKKLSAPEPDDYDVLDDLLSDSDSTTVDPVLEKQPESSAESSAKSESLADSKSSTEPVVVPASEQPIPEPDTEPEVDWDLEPKEGKDLWAKYQDVSDDYDWEILAFEVDRKELADLIRAYKENRNAEIIPTPLEAANGIIDDWDEEDTEGAINDIL